MAQRVIDFNRHVWRVLVAALEKQINLTTLGWYEQFLLLSPTVPASRVHSFSGWGWLPGLCSGQSPGLTGRGGSAGWIWGSVRGFEWDCVGSVSYESRWGQRAWIGMAGKLGWVGPGCTPQCFCVLSHPCVCVYGKEVVVVVWAYVRSCAHIHQWNVKRKEEGSVLGLVVFCSLSHSAAL